VSARKGILVPTLAALLTFVALLSLGFWQLQRKAWKEALIASMNERLAAAPVDLPGAEIWPLLNPENSEFRRVRFRAEFAPTREVYAYVAGSALRSDIKEPGYFVFRPGRLPDGRTVVVNRGYVPLEYSAQSPAGTIEVTGYLRWPENTPWFMTASNTSGDTWFVRDQRAMAAAQGWGEVAPFYVDQETPIPPGGLPRPSALSVTLRNDHLGYALTWFGLAAVLVGVFGFWLLSRRREATS
jgi:surfeit locus 1 family protein